VKETVPKVLMKEDHPMEIAPSNPLPSRGEKADGVSQQ
jgi:hypothetical protein